MCTVALYENELWITLRIPIVNTMEQWIRSVPTSHQKWIRDTMNEFGLTTTLFKNRIANDYMVVTNTNLELCSKLGSSRVCSFRKTRFRDSEDYMVPLDFSHDRLIIITNSTKKLAIKSICNNSPKEIVIENHVIMKVPHRCSIIAKNLEISKFVEVNIAVDDESLGKIESVELRHINKAHHIPVMNESRHQLTKNR